MINRSNNGYFIISGLLSFFFFLIMLIIFSFAINGAKKAKSFALKKDVYVSVNLNKINLPKKIIKKSKKTIEKKVSEKKFEPKKESSKVKNSKPIDLASLFSNVNAQKIVHKKVEKKNRKIDNRFEKSLSKDAKTLKKSNKKLMHDRVRKIELSKDKITLVNKSASTGEHVDEYLAKLQGFVYQNFFPPVNSEGSSVKVRINIDSNSKMISFKVLVLSNNDLLNSEIKNLENLLSTLYFPKNPDGESMTIDIILTAQE